MARIQQNSQDKVLRALNKPNKSLLEPHGEWKRCEQVPTQDEFNLLCC